jgi:hypothetical protein
MDNWLQQLEEIRKAETARVATEAAAKDEAERLEAVQRWLDRVPHLQKAVKNITGLDVEITVPHDPRVNHWGGGISPTFVDLDGYRFEYYRHYSPRQNWTTKEVEQVDPADRDKWPTVRIGKLIPDLAAAYPDEWSGVYFLNDSRDDSVQTPKQAAKLIGLLDQETEVIRAKIEARRLNAEMKAAEPKADDEFDIPLEMIASIIQRSENGWLSMQDKHILRLIVAANDFAWGNVSLARVLASVADLADYLRRTEE